MFSYLRRQAEAFRGDRSGSPALEFALTAPLLFAIVFGAMELGRGLYENNRFNAAAALATRTVALNADASDDDIKAAVLAKLGDIDPDDLVITIGEKETIAGEDFKKIEVGYKFNFLINLGGDLSGFDLSTTRYAPVVEKSTSSSSGSSSSGGGSDSGGSDSGSGSGDDCVSAGNSGKCK